MKKVIALAISMAPFNGLRVFLYNLLMGYHVSYSARIGWGTLIFAKKVSIKKSRIGRFNKFSGAFELAIGEGTVIGSFNEFTCTHGSANTASCTIEDQVLITNSHFFDASGGLIIKNFVCVAGRGSQFWTHGGQRKKTAIVLHEKCYIASAVRFAQGVEIAENSFVGLGSVVVDSFDSPGVLIFGNPAKVIKTDITARLSLSDKGRALNMKNSEIG